MYKVNPQAFATCLALLHFGQGLPVYMFEGLDILDALAARLIEERSGGMYLTPIGEKVTKAILSETSLPPGYVLDSNTNEETLH